MQLSIYFPRKIAIDNPRLWIVQNCCGCATALAVIVSLVYTKIGYVKQITPDSLIVAWVNAPNNSANTSLTYWGGNKAAFDLQQSADAGTFDYAPDGIDYTFEKPIVAMPCNGYSTFAWGSCLSDRQAYTISRSESIDHRFLEETVFIPTAYNEEHYRPGISSNDVGCTFSTLPSPIVQTSPGTFAKKTSPGRRDTKECRTTQSYLVPGVEKMMLSVMNSYTSTPPKSLYHKMFRINRDIKGRLAVSIRDKDNERLSEFMEEEIVTADLGDLLRISGVGLDDKVSGPGIPKNKLTGIGKAARPQVVGTQLTFSLNYLNIMFERGPLLDMVLKGKSTWQGMTETDEVGNGIIRTRRYSGIRIRFIRKGIFEYFQMHSLIFSVTTFVVWIRMPAFAVFFFAVYALGTLSKIYSNYLYQDLNLHNEFNGVSARLLKRNHGFQDLYDLVDQDGVKAISFQQSKKRMASILEGRKELDESEREYFAAYFFSKTATQFGEDGHLAIQLEDYLKAVSSQENLQYDEVMGFIDTDNQKMTFLEKLFLDGSLKAFLDQAKRQPEAEAVVAPEEEPAESMEGRASGKSSRGRSTKKSMAEKESVLFQERQAATRLGSNIERLSKELDTLRQNRDQLVTRNTDYLHYLTHVQEKVTEMQLGRQSVAPKASRRQ